MEAGDTVSRSMGALITCSRIFRSEKHKNDKPKESPYKNSKIDVTTSKNKDGSWGYSVAIDGRTYNVQPNIPAIPGNRGFNTEDEAKKTGAFVAYKIRNNI